MTALKRLGLGTVQFGYNYGVSNSVGRPGESEISAILEYAAASGIVYLDTAAAYGEAEALIGRLSPASHRFRIVTKLAPIAAERLEPRHVGEIVGSIEASCDRLKSDRLYAVLVHEARDLAKPGAEFIVEALEDARRQGFVERIGASVYDADGLSLVTTRFRPQLVQLPLNVLDRRLARDGWLARLKATGAEIHARSIFLQGLLLMRPSELPPFFEPMRKALADMQARFARSNASTLAAALAFVLRQEHIDVLVVGVNRLSELIEIEAAMAAAEGIEIDFGPAPSIAPHFLNPALWPSRV
jgi:aryl-alcohol dehydrogenase-like predicted oxidoreductase